MEDLYFRTLPQVCTAILRGSHPQEQTNSLEYVISAFLGDHIRNDRFVLSIQELDNTVWKRTIDGQPNPLNFSSGCLAVVRSNKGGKLETSTSHPGPFMHDSNYI